MSSRARYMATCRGQVTRAVREGREQLLGGELEVLAGRGLDLGERARLGGLVWVEAVEHLCGKLGSKWPPGQRAEGDDADQGSLERSHVDGYALRDDLQSSAGRRADVVLVDALTEDRESRVDVGWRMSATRPAVEALAQAVFERLEVARRAVGGEHQLRPGFVESVEGVEELLLGAGLALEELDVVDEQDVHVAETRLEVVHPTRAERESGTRW